MSEAEGESFFRLIGDICKAPRTKRTNNSVICQKFDLTKYASHSAL